MSENINFENIYMDNPNLPVIIKELHHDSLHKGCDYHWHEAIEIYYVKTGSLLLNIDGKTQRLYPGDVGIVYWGLPHRGSDFFDQTKHYIFQINVGEIPYLSSYSELQMPTNQYASIFKTPISTTYLDYIIEEMQKKQPAFELAVVANIFNFFRWLLSQKEVDKENAPSDYKQTLTHVHSILKYLNHHFTEEITLDDISLKLGLSKPYMSRLFKKHTGQTIIEHLNEQRCQYAATLLLDGISPTKVSELAGYNDYNYFSRTFKKIMTVSPSKYSEQNS